MDYIIRINYGMAYHKFIARLSHTSLKFITKIYHFINAVTTGFWLGVMGDKSLDYADELHYNRSKKYFDDNYNLSGLFRWEKIAIEKYFSNAKSILLLAAGGGRETVALSQMGFEVDSYECNKALVEYGNALLQKHGIKNTIEYLPRDTVPTESKKYDGIIIGWGAYSHIRGKKKRHLFLQKLQPFLDKEAPLMISFLLTRERTRQNKIVKQVADFFRVFSKQGKTDLGDGLIFEFVHYFSEEEIKSELLKVKYMVIGFNSVDYGCIVTTS